MKNRNNIVSYNIAKLLKENGFDYDVYYRIYPDGKLSTCGYLKDYNNDENEEPIVCSAPTYSEAIDWILEDYKIFIEIDYLRIPYNYNKKYKYFVIDVDDEDNDFGGDVLLKSDNAFGTRNEAIEAALKKLLSKLSIASSQLLEQEKNKPTIIDGVEIKKNKEKVEIIID